MKKYIIEVEENKAEAVVNLLAQISVKIGKPTEKEKYYIHFRDENRYVILTEEQFNFLNWLTNEIYDSNWEEVDPKDMFEEI